MRIREKEELNDTTPSHSECNYASVVHISLVSVFIKKYLKMVESLGWFCKQVSLVFLTHRNSGLRQYGCRIIIRLITFYFVIWAFGYSSIKNDFAKLELWRS